MGIRVNLDPSKDPWPCPPGGRGYTFWKDETIRAIPAGGSITYSFTCDVPPSYLEKDSCIILLEKIHTDSSIADDVPIRLKMNNVEIHVEYHSRIAGHDFWLGINPASHPSYNDQGRNELKVENLGKVAITVWSCFIYRVYQSKPDCPCLDDEPNMPKKVINAGLNPSDDPINLDPSKDPWPCEPGNGGRGYTFWKDDTDRTISPGEYLEYKFTCDYDPPTYRGKDACLVLLEKVQIDADATTNDVPILLSLQSALGEKTIHYEYHSKKKNHDIWIGVDLATSKPGEELPYNDKGENIFRIKNCNSARTIKLLSCYVFRIYACRAKSA